MGKVFAPNLDKFSSAYFVAQKDTYELEVIKVTYRTQEALDKRQGSPTNGQKVKRPIVSVLFRIIKGDSNGTEFADKPVSADFWLGDEDRDWQKLLAFVGTCKGIEMYTEEGDEKFKSVARTLDLSVDEDTGTLGAAYAGLANARVRCSLDQRIVGDKKYQDFGRFLPF